MLSSSNLNIFRKGRGGTLWGTGCVKGLLSAWGNPHWTRHGQKHYRPMRQLGNNCYSYIRSIQSIGMRSPVHTDAPCRQLPTLWWSFHGTIQGRNINIPKRHEQWDAYIMHVSSNEKMQSESNSDLSKENVKSVTATKRWTRFCL